MTFPHPIALSGQRIGLLGGSFDPPHAGHMHITRWGLKAVGLDQVWWLVSPGNPLKVRGPATFERRLTACRQLANHPRVHVSDIERHLVSPYTAHTLRHLRARFSGVRFVWMMGADNLAQFHCWRDWRWIIETVPMAIFARPGEQLRGGLSPAARLYARRRVAGSAAGVLGRGEARWCLLTGPMSSWSSTAIRKSGDWG